MTEITMPRLSDSMEEGTILKWLIEPGQPVAKGDDLVEIETDKANRTHQADADGLLEIVAAEGDTLAVGEPIARLGRGGEGTAPVAEPAAQPAARVAAPPALAADSESADVPAGDSRNADTPTAATPLARRVARSHGVALGALTGSGPRGRITKADVLAAAGEAAEPPRAIEARKAAAAPNVGNGDRPPAPSLAPSPGAPATEGPRIVPMTRLQQVVARRMAEAKSTVPEFQVQTEVAMDAAIALRAKLKEAAGESPAPSFNDLIVKAAALALREHPRANASFREEGFELHDRINVGVAVAADDALVVPTLFDADRKSLGEISRESRRLAEQVRSGGITPPELSGGTFTVSNLGMFGMTAIAPVINPPQAAILGVGAMRTVLTRDGDGEVVDRTLLTLTLTCDHRILYGADAARFLAEVKVVVEQPLRVAL